MTVYLVATTTPPVIVCPPWCMWDYDYHLDDLENWEGRAVHNGAYHFRGGDAAYSTGSHLDINLGQTLLPDGTPGPGDADADTSLFICGISFTPAEGIALGKHIIEVATAASEGRAPIIPPGKEAQS